MGIRWLVTLVLLVGLVPQVQALDVVKTYGPGVGHDMRYEHPYALLDEALHTTIDDYGPYHITHQFTGRTRDRALLELEKGELLNVVAVPTRPEWEAEVIPIRIPIRKDVLDYRLLLVRRDSLPALAKVSNADELKQFRFGMQIQWTTTDVLERLGFNVVTTSRYANLFPMLNAGRFDVFLRGVYEIFDEVEHYSRFYPDLVIEPTLAVELPMPTYFFVSPKTPRLAERIKTGLRRMLENGDFDKIFDQYYGGLKGRIRLDQRHIIRLPNPFLAKPKGTF